MVLLFPVAPIFILLNSFLSDINLEMVVLIFSGLGTGHLSRHTRKKILAKGKCVRLLCVAA